MISGKLLKRGVSDPVSVRKSLQQYSGYEIIRSTMHELEERNQQKRPFNLAVLPVLARQLRLYQV